MSSSFFKLIIGLVLLAVLIQPIAAEACSFCEFINLSKGDPGPQGPQGEMNQTPGTTSHNLLLNLTYDDHLQYANLTGRPGGQTLTGGVSASDALVLNGSQNNGNVVLQPNTGYTIVGNAEPISSLTVSGGSGVNSGLTITDVVGDRATKYARTKGIMRNTSEEPYSIIVGSSSATANNVYFGGGSGVENSATNMRFYTSSVLGTLTGTARMNINNKGNIAIGLGNTAGTSQVDVAGSTRFRNCSGTPTMDAGGNMTCASDPKLKTAVQPYISDTAKVASVTPIKYKWNAASGYDTTHTNTGFDAEQIAAIYPECVIARADMRYEQQCTGQGDDQACETVGIPTGTQTLSLDDKCLIAVQWNALKDQQLKIANLELRLTALEKGVVLKV
jgi:hypothetical protein